MLKRKIYDELLKWKTESNGQTAPAVSEKVTLPSSSQKKNTRAIS